LAPPPPGLGARQWHCPGDLLRGGHSRVCPAPVPAQIRARTRKHLVCKSHQRRRKARHPPGGLCEHGGCQLGTAGEGGTWTKHRSDAKHVPTAALPGGHSVCPLLSPSAFPLSLHPTTSYRAPPCPTTSHRPKAGDEPQNRSPPSHRATRRSAGCWHLPSPPAVGGPEGPAGTQGCTPSPAGPALEPSRRRSQTAPRGAFALGLLRPARGRLAIMLIP